MKYPVNILCRCGCGTIITEVSKKTYWRLKRGDPVGYVFGHRHRGEQNPRWNNRTSSTQDGKYVLVWCPNHPNARKSGYILEHRLIMSEHINRPLVDSEIVHHRNGDTHDNRIENLEITTRDEHPLIHNPDGPNCEKNVVWVSVTCLICGVSFKSRPQTPTKPIRKYCSLACRNKRVGEDAPHAKFTNDDISRMRSERKHTTLAKLSIKYGISLTHLKRVLKQESRQ